LVDGGLTCGRVPGGDLKTGQQWAGRGGSKGTAGREVSLKLEILNVRKIPGGKEIGKRGGLGLILFKSDKREGYWGREGKEVLQKGSRVIGKKEKVSYV